MFHRLIRGTRLAHRRFLVILTFPPSALDRVGRRCDGAGSCCCARARSAQRHGARGFTIPEVLAVVIIIGIFAAAASPTFIQLMRDRRVNRAAMEITGLYRLARSRALGRSNPVLVRWRESGADQGFQVREGIVRRTGDVFAEGCKSITDWQDPTQAQLVTDFKPKSFVGATYELAGFSFLDENANAQAFAEMCFSARGRTFVRYADGALFDALTGVPRVNVANTRTGLVRTVFIPPNGVARMAL